MRACRLGDLHVYVADLLKPEATRWRLALWGVATGQGDLPAPPLPGRVTIAVHARVPRRPSTASPASGTVGMQAVRVDMVDRLARAMHGARDGRDTVRTRCQLGGEHRHEPRWLRPADARARLPAAPRRRGGGLRLGRHARPSAPRDNVVPINPANPFAALAKMKG